MDTEFQRAPQEFGSNRLSNRHLTAGLKDLTTSGTKVNTQNTKESIRGVYKVRRLETFRRCLCNFFSRRNEGPDTWEEELKLAVRFSTSLSANPHVERRMRNDGFRHLQRLVTRLESHELQRLNIKHLMWSSLGCYFYYQHDSLSVGMMECTRRRMKVQSNLIHIHLAQKLLPQNASPVIHYALDYISSYQLWSLELLCFKTIQVLLDLGVSCELLLDSMLDMVDDYIDNNLEVTRQIVRVLYRLMEDYTWPPLGAPDVAALKRLLSMYHEATLNIKAHYGRILKGLEVCTRRILENLLDQDIILLLPQMLEWAFERDITDDALLEFGSILEHAAMIYKSKMYSESLPNDLFKELLRMVSSESRIISHLGNRVLHQLLDRHSNRHEFDSPKIFFQNTHFNFLVGDYNSGDKFFIKEHRESIHDALLKAFIQHGYNRLNMESTYTTICLISVEVPCGFTAAAMVCLVMNFQEAVRQLPHYEGHYAFHAHATVMAVMSLLCWVHKAPDFYIYVNKVMSNRSEQAPHLNPPLRNHYVFAQHHVLWDKPELFFEDWEVRYGLWKCFKIRNTAVFNLHGDVVKDESPTGEDISPYERK